VRSTVLFACDVSFAIDTDSVPGILFAASVAARQTIPCSTLVQMAGRCLGDIVGVAKLCELVLTVAEDSEPNEAILISTYEARESLQKRVQRC